VDEPFKVYSSLLKVFRPQHEWGKLFQQYDPVIVQKSQGNQDLWSEILERRQLKLELQRPSRGFFSLCLSIDLQHEGNH
jgi:hypothetical protein